MTAELREELVTAMRSARSDYESKKAIYISPYSGHDALVAFHEARGTMFGLAKAVEILDEHERNSNDT